MHNINILPPPIHIASCAVDPDNGAKRTSVRLGYIDAMRGMSMILVVFGHALLFMDLPTDTTLCGAVLLTFRMPLFFFISGFFAFRVAEKWTASLTIDVLVRKVKAQIIGTLFFYTIFSICHQKPVLLWLNEGFSWFWFTIALFQMFAIYLVITLVFKNCKYGSTVIDVLLITIAFAFFVDHILHPLFHSRISHVLEWYYLTEYFQYFVFGIICRKYFVRFRKLLEMDRFRTVSILTFLFSLIAIYSYDRILLEFNSTLYRFLSMILVRYFGLISIFILFFLSKQYFENSGFVQNSMKLIGQRTLDIYMLHIFFMPTLFWLGTYLTDGTNMILIQLTCGLVISLLNISICLAVSKLLRCSDFLSNNLFGTKPSTTSIMHK